MITKNVTVTIKDDRVSLGEKIILYQQDKGIEIYFTLKGLTYAFPQGGLDGIYVDAQLQKPNGTIVNLNNLSISNGKVKFNIDSTMTDELTEVGTHLLQIRLYDSSSKTNRVSIPPISFEVKGTLS